MQILTVIFNLCRLICYFLDQDSGITCQKYQITRLKSIIPNIETKSCYSQSRIKIKCLPLMCFVILFNVLMLYLYLKPSIPEDLVRQKISHRGVLRGK